MEKTAIPTLHSHEEPQVNGIGLVNAYKLGEVGKRLKEKCKNKGSSCFKKEILNEENYRFDLDDLDKNLKRDLNKTFPSCAIGKKPVRPLERSNCDEKGKILQRLRKAILLNPKESREFLNSLSCIYKEGGFSQNAEALDKLALALSSREEVRVFLKSLARKEEPISDEALRLMLGMGGIEGEFMLSEQKRGIEMARGIGVSTLSFLEQALNNPDLDNNLKMTIISEEMDGMGESALPFLENIIETGEPGLLHKQALITAGRMGEVALPLVKKAFNTGNDYLQRGAIEAAGEIGKAGLPLVEKAFNTGRPDLQLNAVVAAGWIGEAGLPLVKQAFNIDNLGLKKAAVFSAGEIGEAGLPLVEEAFSDPDLQRSAVMAAGWIGRSALPLLKRVLKSNTVDPTIKKEIKEKIKQLE